MAEETKINGIDNEHAEKVAITKAILNFIKNNKVFVTLISAIIAAVIISFFAFGGLDTINKVFGKQPTVIQTQGSK